MEFYNKSKHSKDIDEHEEKILCYLFDARRSHAENIQIKNHSEKIS